MARKKKKAPAFEFRPYVPPTVRFNQSPNDGPLDENSEKYHSAIECLIKHGGRTLEACAELGVSFSVFNGWMARYPDFDKAVQCARQNIVAAAWDGIEQDLNHPDPMVREMARKHVNKFLAHKHGFKQQENTINQTNSSSAPGVININLQKPAAE